MPEAPGTTPAAPVPAVTLVNRRSQPVELHFGSVVRVLMPGARTAVDATQLATPQVAWLIARKVLVVQATPPKPEPVEALPPRASEAVAMPPEAPGSMASATPVPAEAATPLSAEKSVEPSSRAASGASRPAAKPASTKRATKRVKA